MMQGIGVSASRAFMLLGVGAALAGALAGLPSALAQDGAGTAPAPETADQARDALDQARRQQRAARARAERLERQAALSREASDRAQSLAAGMAARIQQAEAGIAAAEAELALIKRKRRALDLRLAERRRPLVQLTGALQSMARRPLALSLFQPGSMRDLVHTRAVLAGTLPQIRTRTASLRNELTRARDLQADAQRALAERREAERMLAQRRTDLVSLAQEERFSARRVGDDARRESQRALQLAERTRDLDALAGELERASSLRAQLAALPGPILRPRRPEAARLVTTPPTPRPSSTAPPARYQLPVTGRISAGFGEERTGGARQTGLVMIPREEAQVVAPGAGRVAFAGPYRGYGRIVIVEHPNGWTSLVTGLATLDTAVGRQVTAGSPLGLAPSRGPRINLELRHDGEPVNPLDHLR